MTLNYSTEGGVVTGMAPIEDIWTDYSVLYHPDDHFLLSPFSADKRQLPPIPDGVRNVIPEAIGTIDFETMTFLPEVFTPVYLE